MKNDKSNISNREIIDSKFGKINIDIDKKICFAHGIIGLEDSKNFVITNIPSKENLNFKIMQSIDNFDISFLVMIYDINENLINHLDIEKAIELFKIPKNDFLIMFITYIIESKIIVNLRAPLFINIEDRTAIQYVFGSEKYPLKYELNRI